MIIPFRMLFGKYFLLLIDIVGFDILLSIYKYLICGGQNYPLVNS